MIEQISSNQASISDAQSRMAADQTTWTTAHRAWTNASYDSSYLPTGDDGGMDGSALNASWINITGRTNLTWNETADWNTDDLIFTSLTSAILGILILATIVGKLSLSLPL